MTDPSLKTGTIPVQAGHIAVAVPFAEPPSRNGVLQVNVAGHCLDARQLADLAHQLLAEEQALAEGRARYLRAASSLGILAELEREHDLVEVEWEANVSPALAEEVREQGTLMASVGIDCGSPGGGGGYKLYLHQGAYYVADDCGMHGDVGDLLRIYSWYRWLRRRMRIESTCIKRQTKRLLQQARRQRARDRRQRIKTRRAARQRGKRS